MSTRDLEALEGLLLEYLDAYNLSGWPEAGARTLIEHIRRKRGRMKRHAHA